MSAFDFHKARELSRQRFSALGMALMMAGTERQTARFRATLPELAQEFDARRRSPGGRTRPSQPSTTSR